jgi:hypothetical protein
LSKIHHRFILSSSSLTYNPPCGGAAKRAFLLYFGVFKEKAMTLFIIILTTLFVLGGISPLLITDDVRDIVAVGQ